MRSGYHYMDSFKICHNVIVFSLLLILVSGLFIFPIAREGE